MIGSDPRKFNKRLKLLIKLTRDLARNTFVAPATRRNLSTVDGFSRHAGLNKFDISPQMSMAFFNGQVVPVEVLGKLPQLSGDRVIIDFGTINVRPAQRLGGGETMRASNQEWNPGGQLSIEDHFIDHADCDRMLEGVLKSATSGCGSFARETRGASE